MNALPPATIQVKSEHKCDICNDKLAPYYNLTWYIHFCSVECFNLFLVRYYDEIDSIAIEITDAESLFRKEEESDNEK